MGGHAPRMDWRKHRIVNRQTPEELDGAPLVRSDQFTIPKSRAMPLRDSSGSRIVRVLDTAS